VEAGRVLLSFFQSLQIGMILLKGEDMAAKDRIKIGSKMGLEQGVS